MSDELVNNSPDQPKPRPASQPSASVSDSDASELPCETSDGAHEDDPSRDPFEELASEFAERQRAGGMPSIDEYALAHPELAAEIRELFPTARTGDRFNGAHRSRSFGIATL